MTYTNFPNGATSFGIPLVGGIGGIPFTGNWYFVDAAAGSDGNEGTVDAPLQTIARAYALCTDGNNDVVALIGAPLTSAPTTGTFRLSATLTWAKSATHMIGITAPTRVGQRARIAPLTTATTNINPLFSVTAQGCVFANFSFFQGMVRLALTSNSPRSRASVTTSGTLTLAAWAMRLARLSLVRM